MLEWPESHMAPAPRREDVRLKVLLYAVPSNGFRIPVACKDGANDLVAGLPLNEGEATTNRFGGDY